MSSVKICCMVSLRRLTQSGIKFICALGQLCYETETVLKLNNIKENFAG